MISRDTGRVPSVSVTADWAAPLDKSENYFFCFNTNRPYIRLGVAHANEILIMPCVQYTLKANHYSVRWTNAILTSSKLRQLWFCGFPNDGICLSDVFCYVMGIPEVVWDPEIFIVRNRKMLLRSLLMCVLLMRTFFSLFSKTMSIFYINKIVKQSC